MNLQHRDYVEHGWMTLRAKLKEKNHRKWKKKRRQNNAPHAPVVIQANISETQKEQILWDFHSRYLVVIRFI